jgi:DNA-binding NarL/FixJ family response regulator
MPLTFLSQEHSAALTSTWHEIETFKEGEYVKHHHEIVPAPLNHSPMLIPSGCMAEADAKSTNDGTSGFGIDFNTSPTKLASMSPESFRVAWVDSYRLTRECIMKAFVVLHPQLVMLPFASMQDCVESACGDLDLIIYHSHSFDVACLENITALRQAFGVVPLIVLSDADDAQQIKTIPETLKSGAHGFISTRTTDISMVFAAIRFVQAGGTFAPLDLLLTERPARAAEQPEITPAHRLTLRQMAVLSHLQQGKANKIIAHELGMSESTVKVHVRNIMRKMGATNRTQAVFKAQKIWANIDGSHVATV